MAIDHLSSWCALIGHITVLCSCPEKDWPTVRSHKWQAKQPWLVVVTTPESVIAGNENLKLPVLHPLQHCCPDFLFAMAQCNPESAPGVELPLPVGQHTCGSYNQDRAPPEGQADRLKGMERQVDCSKRFGKQITALYRSERQAHCSKAT